VIGFVIIEMIFIINWALWLGSLIGRIGESAVANGSTGIEAFLWSNINFFIFFFLILINLLIFRFGGGQ